MVTFRTRYRDDKERELFVDEGIGGSWATYWRKHTGSLCRVKSSNLPPREHPTLAQRDLDALAKERGWEASGLGPVERPR